MQVWAFTGPRPNPLAEVVPEVLAVNAPFTATVQELHLVALHIVCAAMDAELGLADAMTTLPGSNSLADDRGCAS
jgi:D-sedoheptulose 7-phosphate isomerase